MFNIISKQLVQEELFLNEMQPLHFALWYRRGCVSVCLCVCLSVCGCSVCGRQENGLR